MLRRTILGLAAWASASAMAAVYPHSIAKIEDPNECPGATGNYGLSGVVPHLSTMADATGAPWRVTLIVRTKDEVGTPTHVFRLCGFTPDGLFIGGSTVHHTDSSRMWFNQETGSEDISLADLLQLKTEDELKFREFQLHYRVEGPSMVEYGVAGNSLQAQAFSRAPTEPMGGVFFPDGRGFVGGLDTVLYISRTAGAGSTCEVAVDVYDEEGAVVVCQPRVKIPPRGAARVDLGKLAPRANGALKVWPSAGTCGDLYVSRETSYRSNAVGGSGLFIDVRQ